jgi:hypothetical protein
MNLGVLEFEQVNPLPKSLYFHCRKPCTLIAEFFVLVLPKILYFTLPFTLLPKDIFERQKINTLQHEKSYGRRRKTERITAYSCLVNCHKMIRLFSQHFSSIQNENSSATRERPEIES